MARIRTIKPDFFTSEDIVEISPLARLLYIAIWCEADREGRLEWKPKTFKLRYLPADNVDIMALCEEIIQRGLVVLYGDGLAYIPTFVDHQHINSKEAGSLLPSPHGDADASATSEPRENDASTTRESRDNNVTAARNGRDAHAPSLKGKERKGKERNGKEDASQDASPLMGHPGFPESWKAWGKHRQELRKPMTPEQAKRQLKALERLGPQRAIAAIEHSIARGWQGIYEEKHGEAASGQSEPEPTGCRYTPEELERLTS